MQNVKIVNCNAKNFVFMCVGGKNLETLNQRIQRILTFLKKKKKIREVLKH